MNSKILLTISILVALAVTTVSAYWLGARAGPSAAPHGESTPAEKAALYWYDPMVPDQHFDKPGKSPFMDMQLLPKYANADESSVIRVSSAARQNLGVRTALVETGTLESSLRVPG
ncbi:MAG: heavy metal-binding domain-containing protein, partial [Dokdonella sp.]